MKRILTGICWTSALCLGNLHAEGISLSDHWYHEVVVEELEKKIDKLAATVQREQAASPKDKTILAELQKQRELQTNAIVKALADYFLDQGIAVDEEDSQDRLNSFRNMLVLLRQVKERPDVALVQQIRQEIVGYSRTALAKDYAPASFSNELLSEIESPLDSFPDIMQKKRSAKKHVEIHKTKKGTNHQPGLSDQEEPLSLDGSEDEVVDGDALRPATTTTLE